MQLVVFAAIVLSINARLILPPIKQTKQVYALIWIQGAQCEPESYLPVVEQIQKQFPYSLWVAVPQFIANMPEPLRIGPNIHDTIKDMEKQGMPSDIQLFIGGHSLGSVILQQFIHGKVDIPIIGILLHGGYIGRGYRDLLSNGKYKINGVYPTLTLAGELDGLSRITRIAESFYTQQLYQDQQYRGNYPVFVLKGVSHNQFASGEAPSFVKARDLQPEISYDEAHLNIARVSSNFMVSVLEGKELTQDIYTENVLKSILEAFELEGNVHIKPPCNGKKQDDCFFESPWSEYAQRLMGDVENINVNSILNDDVGNVFSSISNSCEEVGDDGKCQVEVTLQTQNVNSNDQFDGANTQILAKYQKVKLVSRQKIYLNDGLSDEAQDFAVTDGQNICGYINQRAVDWAMQNLPSETVERYEKYGRKILIGDDKVQAIGPQWLYSGVNKKEEDSDKLQVFSSSLKTPADYMFASIAGVHYCMILTPGAVAEWMFVDGLRENYKIQNRKMK